MTSSNLGILVVASGLSCAVGAACAHILTKKHMTALYEGLIEEEVAKAREFYSQRNKADKETAEAAEELIEEAAEQLQDCVEDVVEEDFVSYNKITQTYGSGHIPKSNTLTPNPGESIEEFEQRLIDEAKAEVKAVIEESGEQLYEEEDVVVHRNIFQNHGPSDRNELDRSNRSSTRPYIIDQDEFTQADLEYNQNTLTYYEADGVLVDEQDQPVPIAQTVGEKNLQFGNASGDVNIVYIRNDSLEVDFEVCRSFGSYTEEVLGVPAPEDRRNKGRG